MKWYDIRRLVGNRAKTDPWRNQDNGLTSWDNDIHDLIIVCCNPQCGKPILDEEICYIPSIGKVYHTGECQQIGVAHEVFNSRQMFFGNYEYISREMAHKLMEKGEIKIPPGLGDNVIDDNVIDGKFL